MKGYARCHADTTPRLGENERMDLNPDQRTELADQLAAMREPMEDGRIVVSKAGRAYLKGAETALRATNS